MDRKEQIEVVRKYIEQLRELGQRNSVRVYRGLINEMCTVFEAALTTPQPELCIWQVEEGGGYVGLDSYQTSCGHKFLLEDFSGEGNHAVFCLYCGKPLKR